MKKVVIMLLISPLLLFMIAGGALQQQKKAIASLVGNNDITELSCIYDENTIFENEEIENMRGSVERKVVDKKYVNAVLAIYVLEKDDTTVDDVAKKINKEIEYTIKKQIELEPSAYIQAYKFGNEYFDYLKKNNQRDSSPYFAKLYMQESIDGDFEEADSNFSILAIQQMKNTCTFDGVGINGDGTLLDDEVAKTADMGEEKYKKLMNEATKYIGMPYVYGGSSPGTSFDCSGFIIWVYKQTGLYKMDRITAQGIFNQCAKIVEKDVKPGDLVFFENTYKFEEKVTHLGIYVGNNRMLHCGNPIGYADLSYQFWKDHFYSFGRLPIKK